MLKPCTIVLGLAQDCTLAEGDLIGADRGALICAQAHRRMVMAIGDFDSVTPPQKELIRQYADQMQVLPAMKDETDALSALRWATGQGYNSMVLIGGVGGRQDHQLANLLLVMHQKLPVILREKNNELFCLDRPACVSSRCPPLHFLFRGGAGRADAGRISISARSLCDGPRRHDRHLE